MGRNDLLYKTSVTHKAGLTIVYDSICCIVCVRVVIICRRKEKKILIGKHVQTHFMIHKVQVCSFLLRVSSTLSQLNTVSYKVNTNSDHLLHSGNYQNQPSSICLFSSAHPQAQFIRETTAFLICLFWALRR